MVIDGANKAGKVVGTYEVPTERELASRLAGAGLKTGAAASRPSLFTILKQALSSSIMGLTGKGNPAGSGPTDGSSEAYTAGITMPAMPSLGSPAVVAGSDKNDAGKTDAKKGGTNVTLGDARSQLKAALMKEYGQKGIKSINLDAISDDQIEAMWSKYEKTEDVKELLTEAKKASANSEAAVANEDEGKSPDAHPEKA